MGADQSGCIQNDLLHEEECLKDLMEHLKLKKCQMMRLKKACASKVANDAGDDDIHSVSTAVSAADKRTDEVSVCKQTVLVMFNGLWYSAEVQYQNPDGTLRVIYDEDGTYEDVQRTRVREESVAETEVQVVAAPEGKVKASNRSKTRLRKLMRDAHPLPPPPVLQKPVPKRIVIESGWSDWSETKEGCKAYAELTVPSKYVGWIIGKNGSTIKDIEQTCKVTATVVSQTIYLHGKQERVKAARLKVDKILEGAF